VITSYQNTMTVSGNKAVHPKLVFKRSGGTTAKVAWVKNERTGQVLYCNYGLADGETLTIDLREGYKTVRSSTWGNVIGRAILRNSDLGDFRLLPGDNDVTVMVISTGSPTITGYGVWRKRYWSFER